MKRFTIRLAAFALAAAVVYSSSCGRSYKAANADEIIALLSESGVEVSGEYSDKTVTVPEEFGEVYERYNELQLEQGFDLYDYRSREATVYTFEVISVHGEGAPGTQAHVMICDGKVIAGDIASPAIDGAMKPLFE
ncbi:MAG: DUF4830 domain-containing protein [Ruminiclostridium sp.]|nr:DUF4830 domain-containing protein [Ruminiclostridium sp.]